MNGAHRKIHHPACPLLLRRRTPRQGMNAPAQKTGVLFPARSKTPLSSLLRPGCSFSFLLNPGRLLSPLSSLLPFLPVLPPFSSMPSCPSSLFLFPLPSPARASAFLPNPGRLLSPPSSPWPFPPVLFFSPILSLPPEKAAKKPFPYGKGFLPSAFPDPAKKKPSQREL